MLTKSIYVSGVNNLSDARYCSGMGVDYIGVNVDEGNSNYMSVEKFKEIDGWLVGVNWIIESDSTSFEHLLEKCKTYGVERIRVLNEELAQRFIDNSYDVIIKSVKLPQNVIDSPAILGYEVEFTLDTLKLFSDGLTQLSIYLSGEITIEELEKINSTENIKGVVLSGGDELRPGFKDMDALIDAIEVFEE